MTPPPALPAESLLRRLLVRTAGGWAVTDGQGGVLPLPAWMHPWCEAAMKDVKEKP